jgi:hypothetical protein
VHACPPPRPRRATAKVVTEVLHAAFSTVEVVAVSIAQLAAVEVRSPRPRCVEPPAVLKVCRATAATEGLYATGHLPASSCRRCLARTDPSPPLPRASTPRPPHPCRAITAAAEGLRAKFTEPPSPLRASTPRPLHPSRAVVAQGRRAKSARPCRAIVVAQGLRRYTGLHTRPPAHSLARSCRSPRRNCPVECLALRWLLYIRHCIYCIGEALHHLPLTNAFHYWSQPKHRWWRWRRGTNSMRIGYTDVAHRT